MKTSLPLQPTLDIRKSAGLVLCNQRKRRSSKAKKEEDDACQATSLCPVWLSQRLNNFRGALTTSGQHQTQDQKVRKVEGEPRETVTEAPPQAACGNNGSPQPDHIRECDMCVQQLGTSKEVVSSGAVLQQGVEEAWAAGHSLSTCLVKVKRHPVQLSNACCNHGICAGPSCSSCINKIQPLDISRTCLSSCLQWSRLRGH